MRFFIIIISVIFLPLMVEAQFYYGLQTDFGKSRVQYKEFNWTSYQFQEFDTYYYRGGKPLAEYTARTAHIQLQKIEKQLIFNFEKRIQFVIYNSFSDFKQSNIGYKQHDDYNIGGKTQIVGSKVLLYFDGDYNHLKKQIAAGITKILLNEMMYGGNMADAFTNSTLLNLPNWFVDGLVAFISDPWNMQMDNMVKDKIGTEDFKNFNHLEKEEALLAGYSIWHYISNTYGNSAVAEILYMVRQSRNIENGFQSVLGKSVKTINQEWLDFYFQTDITGIYPSSNSLQIKIKSQEKITQIEISPKGRKIAFVTNEMGKYRIYLYDLKSKKQTKIESVGHKLDRITDITVPVIAWEPKGKKLAFTTEKKGKIQMNYYDISKEKINTFELQHLQKVLSMTYDKKGKVLLFSAVRQNQTDIFTFGVVGHKLTNITNDKYLDLNPCFSPNNEFIIFSSNRKGDILYEESQVFSHNKTNDLFLYNYKTESPKLLRLTDTPEINETNPKPIKDNLYWFLSDENGLSNRFNLKIDSTKVETDTNISYQKNFSIFPFTNYNRDIICFDSKPKARHLVEVLYLNGNYTIYDKNLSRKIKKPKINLTDSYFLHLKKSKIETEFEPKKSKGDSLWRENKINIKNYQFGDFKEIKNRLNKKESGFQTFKKPSKLPKPRNYFISFTTDYVVSQFDNSYITKSYQPYTNFKMPLFLNPNFDALIKVGTADLFEDYKIIGGVRLSGDLKSNGYMLSFLDNKYRLDKSYIFSRQTINLIKDNALQRTISNEMRGVVNWPFDEVFSTRSSISFRNDKTVFMATDIINLVKENTYSNWITLRNEVVFDNTINKGLNLYNGGRYKIFAEYYRLLEDAKTDMIILGLDARNYKKVSHSIIWANRIAASTSFGNQKLLYYMGGVDAWLMPKFNQETDVAENENYSYQTLATNMRGFHQNVRNGNSFFVVNTELRVPLFKYILRRPITSDFINNFQIITFADFGTAWNGSSPFAKGNQFNFEVIENGPVTITIDKQKNPFVGGFGFGARSRLFGYFLRADWAWGVEDGYILPNILYISLGLDF
ncbi:MAG: PD40 domain-containing protein [Flavobacteriales bacterium]|nr:PD40 domain-containing protein [Flavobacteriales bacterium]